MSLSSAILNAKYYQYDPVEVSNIVEFNESVANLLEEDNIVIAQKAETDEFNLSWPLSYNFQELENACPEWQQGTHSILPKWLEHHQSRHLTKNQQCPTCMEEAGSKVAHKRKRGDRQPGVMHVDLVAFEVSAVGNKYGLVAAVTIELDKESKLLPVFVPMPKKDAACALTAIQEVLTLCQDRNLHQVTGSCESKPTTEESLTTRSSRIYVGTGTSFCPFLQHIDRLQTELLSEWLVS